MGTNPMKTTQGGTSLSDLKDADEHGAHVIIASEPTTYKEHEWELIEKNTCVMVDKTGDVRKELVNVAY